MSFGWSAVDILTVTKLAWDLYHTCFIVAKEAPEDFRQLLNELASLQTCLRGIRDDISSDASFFDKLDESRKQTLERCIQNCFNTLRGLQELIIKYRELGIGDGASFWKKIRWTYKKTEIADMKSKVMVHTCQITLCMSSIGNSSLARIETQMMVALSRQEGANLNPTTHSQEDEGDIDDLSTIGKVKTVPAQHSNNSEPNGLGIGRMYTGSTVAAGSIMSPDPPSSMGGEEVYPFGSPQTPSRGKQVPLPLRQKSTDSGSNLVEKDDNGLPLSPFSTPSPPAVDDYEDKSPKTSPDGKMSTRAKRSASATVSPTRPDGRGLGNQDPNLSEIVAEAMKTLAKIRQQELSARPIHIRKENPDHQAEEALKARFQKFADDELDFRRLNAKDWLRVATWWLLKARFNTRLDDKERYSSTRGSFSVSSEGKSAINQAYIDLLKASWILYSIVLKDGGATSLMTDENRKLFHNVSDGIGEDFCEFHHVDPPERDILFKQNCNIWEITQPEEYTNEDEGLLPGLENGRWITVEQEDAGEEDEKVLFRTFVDAAIGAKRSRMWSKGAPYMLLLSIKEGESEPKVTLCNQSGTLGLTRDFTFEDLQEKDVPISPGPRSNTSVRETIPLNFEKKNIIVAFTNNEDLQNFMDIPRAYFEAVKRREPRQLERATETLLVSRPVEIFERLRASTLRPMNPRQRFNSCDLRILETTCAEGWHTTRRMVISSSAGERKPWCSELFLPLSRVQVCHGSVDRQLTIKWSDCTHEKSDKTDGSYNPIYTFAYDDSTPNIALSLLFRTDADAAAVERILLTISHSPIFTAFSGNSPRAVYNMTDTEPTPKPYKALLLTHSRSSWTYTDLFFMYRDSDYIYSSSNNSIRFPQVYYVDYISTHVDRLYKPEPQTPPTFDHCEKKIGNCAVEFDDPGMAMAFLSSLTASSSTLIFSRRAHFITTKPPPRFGHAKSNKGPAEVQLWLKGNDVRLLSRWGDKVEDKWLTMSLPKVGLAHSRDTNRAFFAKVEFERGRKVDMANLRARDPKEKDVEKSGVLTIAFETVRDREEFATALAGNGPAPLGQHNILEDLLL